MAIGMPVAYALLALRRRADGITSTCFDAQIIAQNLINGADSFPLMAVPFFMLAGEIMNTGGLSKRIVDVALAPGRTRQGRPGLRGASWLRASCSRAVRLGGGRRGGALRAAGADDGAGRPQQGDRRRA